MNHNSTVNQAKQDPSRKPTYRFTPAGIPAELQAVPRWVNWQWRWDQAKGGWDKPPIDASTGYDLRWGDPANLLTFEEALAYFESGRADGVGFLFDDDDDISGVDLDDCRDAVTGEIAAWAQEIVDQLDSDTEISPSGGGLKIFARGDFPHSGKKQGKNASDAEPQLLGGDGTALEMYTSRRYFTVTGQHLPDTPTTVNRRPKQLLALNNRFWATTAPKPAKTATADGRASTYRPAPLDLTDAEVLAAALADANTASRWSGDNSLNGGDASAADQSLVNSLYYHSRRDRACTERLFRQSPRMRDKWDEKGHRADGATYGEMTLDSAAEWAASRWGTEPGPRLVFGTRPATVLNNLAPAPIGDSDDRLAAMQAKVDQLEALVADLSSELQAERDRFSFYVRALRNPSVRQEAQTILGAAALIESRKRRGLVDKTTGRVVIYRGRDEEDEGSLCAELHRSRATITAHLKRAQAWGLLRFDLVNERDRATGEIRTRTVMDFTEEVPDYQHLVRRLGELEVARDKVGRPTGPRRCPNGCEAPILHRVTREYICTECGQLVEEPEVTSEYIEPEPAVLNDFARSEDGAAPATSAQDAAQGELTGLVNDDASQRDSHYRAQSLRTVDSAAVLNDFARCIDCGSVLPPGRQYRCEPCLDAYKRRQDGAA